MNSTTRIGIDVGGSHFSASVIQYQEQIPSIQSSVTNALDSKQSASSFVNTFTNFIQSNINDLADNQPIGIAFPGPFNYPDGICQIYGVGGKFSNLFGLNLKAALQNQLSSKTEIYFANDAHCFALGCHQLLHLKKERAIYITLGTGFGSAFMEDGHLIHDDARIPEGGAFYYLPFKTGIADEYFSTRWFINEAKSISGETFQSVKEIVVNHPSLSKTLFALFCENFADFMIPWLKLFNCEKLIIGGNIAKANALFNDQLIQILADKGLQTEVLYIDETENMIMMGAAYMADKASYVTNFPPKHFPASFVNESSGEASQTNPPILPLTSQQSVQHTIYPSNQIDGIHIEAGFIALAKQLLAFKTVKIDGFGGVLWEVFRTNMQLALDELGIKCNWYSFHSCLKEEVQIKQIIAASLNDEDPVFGKIYTGTIDDFFDADKINAFNPDPAFDRCIIYGTGSSLAKTTAPIVYIDVLNNEIQYSIRAGSIDDFSVTISALSQEIYQQFYFAR
jgi:predicted NBD/HSP70 family sugar kinase